MTPDDNLLARLKQMRDDCYTFARDLSALDDVIELLSVSFPCGWPEPTTGAPAHTVQMGRSTFNSRPEFVEWNGTTMSRSEALGIAAAIIRCATQLPERE